LLTLVAVADQAFLQERWGPPWGMGSVLPLSVGTGRPRPPLSKKSIDFDHEIMENEKK
jgi:hypothetical protein